MADPRVANVSRFTPTRHSSVPDYLDPSKVRLPDGYTACIIGASAGIGEHIAYALASARASTLILASRTPTNLQRVADHITTAISPTTKIHMQPCDVSSPASVAALAAYVRTHILRRSGRLDAVIPNAAYAPPITGMNVTENAPEEVRRAMDTNVVGTYAVAHHFVPMLIESSSSASSSSSSSSRTTSGDREGRDGDEGQDHGQGHAQGQGQGQGLFLVIGSIAGCITKGMIANTGYTISKFAQIRLVEMVDAQFGPTAAAGQQDQQEGEERGDDDVTQRMFRRGRRSVLAVAIHPGAVSTDMAKDNTPEAFMKYLTDDVGLCGAWVVWLASQQRRDVDWMGGRLISACWDVSELMEKRDEVRTGDLLKFELVTK